MSSSSSDENETTIHRSAGSGIYSQPRAGSSKRATRHDISDNEDEEEHYARFREEGVIEVDDAISVLLSSLHFEQKRDVVPNDEDDNRLRELHEKIFAIITNETDVHRRRRLKKTLSASNCVREQVFYLRRKPQNPPAAYYTRLNNALHSIVKESFGEEYRKVATVLGLVEALAEVLILEVQVFGMPEKEHGEHRTIRKLIANALTNLTFGQIHSKRKLCAYDGFIGCVVRIIIESPNITQVYAGLIRNLSWNADSGMSEALQPTVHALAIAAVYAHNHRYDVTAILSALWNLAGHSVENKRTICETRDCLKALASLLSPDARFTSLVDSATGILKYVSQYLANTSTHLELRSLLITRMLSLLKSSSFTCVTNTLGAISNLIAKDPHMQQLIRHDSGSIQQLNVLRNSNRDDIRAAVKSVLNTLNQPMSSSHHRFGAPPDMSLSVGASSSDYQQASPRLLSLRATRASPGRAQQLQIVTPDQRSSSLPRHFAVQRSQFMAMSYNGTMDQHMIYHMQQQQQMSTAPPTQQTVLYLPQYQAPPQPPQVDEEEEDLEIPTSTVMCTRSNSEQSLGSLNPGSVGTTGGWNSTMGTEANTSRALSPVSYSDIPASPTMCAAQNCAQNAQFLAQNPAQNAPNTTQHSNGSANTMTRSDGATTVPMDQLEHLEHLEHLVTPTYAILNPKAPEKELESPEDVLPGPPTMETGEYAVFDDDLLKRSIQSEKPSPRPQKMRVSPRLNGFFSPKELAEQQPPKNGRSDRRAEPIDDRSTEPGFEEQDLDDLEQEQDLEHNLEHFEQEIDSSLPMDCCDEYYDDFDDYYEEEDPDATQFDEGVTIDCSMISNGSLAQGSALATSTPKGSTSSVTKRAVRSRLPVPRTNGSLVEKKKSMIPSAANHRPRLPPKPENLLKKEEIEEPESMENDTKDDTIYVNAPIVEEAEEKERIYMNALKQSSMSTPPPQKSAIVTPYNYQKPHFSNRSTSELHTEKSVTPNPKQMLVTIV